MSATLILLVRLSAFACLRISFLLWSLIAIRADIEGNLPRATHALCWAIAAWLVSASTAPPDTPSPDSK